MNTAEIANKISLLKRGGKVLTNCFVGFDPSDTKEYDAYSTEKTLVIVNREFRVNRVWFYTSAPEELVDLSDRYLRDDEYTLEIITKDPLLLKDVLNSSGFVCIAEMMRLSSNNVSSVFSSDSVVYKYCTAEYGYTAEISDAEEIFDTLWSVFDTRTSHLPEKEAIVDSITKGEILIYKEQEKIVSLLQTVAASKKLYINQVYNSAESKVIHSMLLRRIKDYCEKGGNYIYSWVEKNNIASMKFHQKYNMQHDGLWDMVYTRNVLR